MRTVKILMSFVGDSLLFTVKLPPHFFTDGKLDMRILKNRLEGNCVVREATVEEDQ